MENLCRLCGNECEFMIRLFDNFSEDRRTRSKISTVLQINITEEDDLPKNICNDCHNRLNDAFIFINCCHDTQYRLKELCGSCENGTSGKPASQDLNSSLTTSFILLPKDNNNQKDVLLEATSMSTCFNVLDDTNTQQNQRNATMESVNERNNDSNSVHVDSFTEHDPKKKMKENRKGDQSLVSKRKAGNRFRTIQNKMKILPRKKKKKITKSRGDFDYLAGPELFREKKWTCDTCQMSFSHEITYVEHLTVHSGSRPYGCKLCAASFRKRQELNQHLRTVHSDKEYKCTVCDHVAKHKGKLTEHMKSVHEKPFVCDLCAYRTGEKGKIQQHIANKHNGDLSYVCEICGIGFRTRPSLQAHRMNVHFPEPKMCQICGTTCPSLARYSAHVFRCGKERKRYPCEECDKTYTTKELLKDHMNKHLNIKPYKCDICSKEFYQRNRLDTHKYVHRKPAYQCEVCNQSFNRKDNMKNHMKKHFYKPMKYDNTMITAV